MFLAFLPAAYGTTRHAAALIRYIEALEGRFRGSLYRNTFDPEQYTFTQQTAERFSPETVSEDVVYCTQLLESLQPLLPASRHDAQVGSASGRVRTALARLARHGATGALVQMAKSLFARYAAEASTYGRLVLACAAAGRHDEVTQAGEIYVALGGREPSVLLVFIKSLLLFPSKIPQVVTLLDRHSALLSTFSPLLQMRGLAYLSLQRNGDAVAALEAAVKIDDTDPQTHLLLALAHFAAGNCRMAEQEVKLSLSIEEIQPCGWVLFAAIKSAQKDFDTCLSLCNMFLENCTVPFVPYHHYTMR
jgi:tetratricopeptide (TPR) repeat protein